MLFWIYKVLDHNDIVYFITGITVLMLMLMLMSTSLETRQGSPLIADPSPLKVHQKAISVPSVKWL